MNQLRSISSIDWIMLGSALLLSIAGLLSMESLSGTSSLADRQVVWLGVSLAAFFVASVVDWRLLRRTSAVMIIYIIALFLLALLFALGSVFGGAQGWFNLGAFAVQPADPAKLALVLVLAKYFSRRHIEIAHFRHIIVSGVYAGLVALLLFFQPDFGSAVIVMAVWAAMVLLAGIPVRHLALLAGVAAILGAVLWQFGFEDYQKARIAAFIHPLSDIRGTGYNAYQSVVAVGSGGIFGKGIGYGTQSRLQFLPEHETDFIFASFAEEWGLAGVLILLLIFGTLIVRIVVAAGSGATNFESLFMLGVAAILLVHAAVHIGGNIGLLPVTGTTMPFMSYGGSHLLIGYTMLGMIAGMRRYGKAVRTTTDKEIIDIA